MMHEKDFQPEEPQRAPGRFMADATLTKHLTEIFAAALPENASLLDLSYSFKLSETATHELAYHVAFGHEGTVREVLAADKIRNGLLEIGFIETIVRGLASALAHEITVAEPKLIAGSRIVPAVAVPQGPAPQEG